MTEHDTIAAIATPPGNGGIAVIRISGTRAADVLRQVFAHTGGFTHAKMVFGSVHCGGEELDRGYAVFFCAPHSYTGEDVAELHCHGGQTGVARVLRTVLDSGARLAQPGEFTRRAFLAGKMDLSQAEAVCGFIAAASEESAKVSLRQMDGELKQAVLRLQDDLTDLLAQVEAAVEYPEEDIEPVVTKAALLVLENLRDSLLKMEESFRYGRLIVDGLCVTIAGKPNVGKSSLMNALLSEDRVIVSAIPGTTRDTVAHSFAYKGMRFNLTDTAGIRDTDNAIEMEGVKRSKSAINGGKCVFFILDCETGITPEDYFAFKQIKKDKDDVLVVQNKLDVSEGLSEREIFDAFGRVSCIGISAKTGAGLDALREKLLEYATRGRATDESVVLCNERHLECIKNARGHISDAIEALLSGMDMDCVMIDLNAAWHALGELTGKTVSEEIINRIFEKFCLGK
ncbi:MAG TPA: tRNA uridine-5-carboxymethylaminomethyl(34) synthesis GTPase MnmE [Clostridiales bacterium]|nr:tRNA uridine-5-carboxymethylaminomethyl(34) synthesis GTPase MnmE [Clostridiales bacterium]